MSASRRTETEEAVQPLMSLPSEGSPESPCCSSPAGCSGPSRRDFLQVIGLGAAAALAPEWPVMAGPFEASDFEKLVPADKKLDPVWVRSLTARGEPTVYRDAVLGSIGMPIGGICAGQLYLGGDGTLWHWDIFNRQVATNDAHYADPPRPSSPLDQGFALKITTGGTSLVRRSAARVSPTSASGANTRSASWSTVTRRSRSPRRSRRFRRLFPSARTSQACPSRSCASP